MSGSPHFSVIVPAYNRAALLPRAVESVLDQSYRDFELLVVDDGSTDDTGERVGRFSDRRLRYVRHGTNLGQHRALNTGLELATGSYVSFLDSDDEWAPEMLAKVLDKFRSDQSIGFVYTGFLCEESPGVLEGPFVSDLEGFVYPAALAVLGVGQGSPPSALSIKKSCFDVVGRFEPGVCIDDIMCLRLAKEFKVGRVPEALATLHCDAPRRVTHDAAGTARAYYSMYKSVAAEVVKHCGRATMARHLRYSGDLFLEAGMRGHAFRAYCRSLAYGEAATLARHLRVMRRHWLRRPRVGP